jgi:[protein-PII] uridylyltransferase
MTAPDPSLSSSSDLRGQRLALIDRLTERPTGLAWCSLHSGLADRVIQGLYHDVCNAHTSVPRLALVATGGYGRKELSPWSDLDLALVPLDDTHPQMESVMKSLFSLIQTRCGQGLGLKVGYSFRPLSEVPGLDAATRTAILDSRLIAGSEEAYEALLEEVWNGFPAGHFILAKIEERERAFAKWHDTPLVTRPHLKEGAGGLRCAQAANWIGMALGERPSRPSPSYDRVLRTRNLVHALAGRSQEELTLEKRSQVAELLALEPYPFASQLSQDMLQLHELWTSCRESVPMGRFRLTQRTWAQGGEVRIGRSAGASEAATAVTLGALLGVKPPLALGEMKEGRQSPELLSAISRGEKTIRALDQSGILEEVLPELTRCRHLMPRDGSHQYTVFEHTLRALRRIEELKDSEPFGSIKASLRNPGHLNLAILLHDVGKADPTREHSLSGAEMAREVCQRWGLSRSDAAMVVWLVENHLVMAKFVRMRDVQDPHTAYEFAQLMESEDRLDMLTLLTWADVGAVSSETWTPLQEAFTLHLHRATRAVITENSPPPDPSDARRRISRHLQRTPLDDKEIESFLMRMPAHYVFATPPEKVGIHWKMASQVPEEGPMVRTQDRTDLGYTEVTICAEDRGGLLSQILAVFYAHDLRLASVRASTSLGPNPIAVDVVNAGLGERTVPMAVASRVLSDLQLVLKGELNPDALLTAKGKDPGRRQEILSWTWHPGSPGHLEVRAPRGRGLAYRVSKLISQEGWNIQGAVLSQWAGQGAASFSICGSQGEDLSLEDLQKVLNSGPSP